MDSKAVELRISVLKRFQTLVAKGMCLLTVVRIATWLYGLRKLLKRGTLISSLPLSNLALKPVVGTVGDKNANLLAGMQRLVNGTETGRAQFYIFDSLVFSVLDGSDVREVMNGSIEHMQKPLLTTNLKDFLCGDAFEKLEFNEWKLHNNMVRHALYNRNYQENLCKITSDTTNKMVKVIRNQLQPQLQTLLTVKKYSATLASELSPGIEYDLMSLNKMISVDILGIYLCSHDFKSVEDDDCRNVDKLAWAITQPNVEQTSGESGTHFVRLSKLLKLITFSNNEQGPDLTLIRSELLAMVRQKRNEISKIGYEQSSDDFIKFMLTEYHYSYNAATRSDSEVDEHIVYHLISLFFVGTNATSHLLSVCFYMLSRDKTVEQLIMTEINKVLGEYDSQQIVTPELLSRLKYTEAVLKEATRLFPPTSISFRVASKDIVLSSNKSGAEDFSSQFSLSTTSLQSLPDGFMDEDVLDTSNISKESTMKGYSANMEKPVAKLNKKDGFIKTMDIVVPRGTKCCVPTSWIQRDERNFFKPEEFLPERFLDFKDPSNQRYNRYPYQSGVEKMNNMKSFVPFSDGMGSSLVEHLVMNSATIALVLQLRAFQFTEGPEKLEMSSAGLTQQPKSGKISMNCSLRL